jgi:hypothetical protein
LKRDELALFVEAALTKGQHKAAVAEALRQAGWRSAQIDAALAAYADVDFPVPVPRPGVPSSAREAFLYLLLFTSAYVSVTGLGTILYQLINLAFPDPIERENAYMAEAIEQNLRFGIAMLAVFLPVYLLVDRHIERLKAVDPGHGRSAVRRVLTYLTLYVAATVLLCDAGYLLYRFLEGDLAPRVLLKGLVLGGLAGLILWRYLSEMRSDERLQGMGR